MLRKNTITFFTMLLFVVSLLGSSASVQAEAVTKLDAEAIDQFLSEQVDTNRIPGLAAAVIEDGEVVFIKGYGEAGKGVPVTPQIQFYIGSVTKSFTALAAMQLVEQEKLELDAPVRQYLPWFETADAKASSAITVRHLLNHTSGLNEKGDPNASAITDSLEEQARLLQYVQPYAPAGSSYQYYNQNYRLLGLLIEEVSGQSYAEYLQGHVFEPLGMSYTTADPTQADGLAQGYSRFFGFPLPQEQRFNPGALPSGYIISTAGDMAKYLIAQMENSRADGGPLLDEASMILMHTPPQDIDSNYGMGWMVMDGGKTIAHGGALENYMSFVLYKPDENIGMVLLFNQNSMENMMFSNDAVRQGMLALLDGGTPKRASYGWIGWLLLALAAADMLNHLRLFRQLPVWLQKTSRQNRTWLWLKVIAGILLPSAVLFGLPLLVRMLEGGSPTWMEPLRLMPDLTGWLLLGMSLDLLRSLKHADMLLRSASKQEVA